MADANDLRRSFGERIKLLRQVMNMTQAQLAEAADISLEHVSKLERGVASPSFDLLIRLSEALGVSPAILFLNHSGRSEDSTEDGLAELVTQVGMWEYDIHSEKVQVDEGFRLIMATDLETGAPGDYFKTIHPDDRDMMWAVWGEISSGKAEFPRQFRVLRPDGSVRLVHLRHQVESDEAGEPVSLRGVIFDVTERAGYDRELRALRRQLESCVSDQADSLRKVTTNLGREIAKRRSAAQAAVDFEQRFRHIANTMSEIVWTVEPDKSVSYCNKAFEEVFGVSREELYADGGGTLRRAIHPDDRERVEAAIERKWREGCQFREEYRIVRPDGTVRWIRSRTYPLFDEDGGLVNILGLAEDITSTRQSVDVLRQAKREAEQVSTNQSAFLAQLGHELRTPLTGLLGMLELTSDLEIGEEASDYLLRARKAGLVLRDLVGDLVDLGRIESGRLKVRNDAFELDEMLTDLATTYGDMAQAKGLGFDFKRGPRVAKFVRGDSLRLRQILANLLANAVKYTVSGEVRLVVGRDDGGHVFSVRDTGPGIPVERQEAVFEDFVQYGGPDVRRGGLGLGLTISRRLANLMGGSIELESIPGGGSTFRLGLPLAPVDPASLPRVETASARSDIRESLRLLVVDDDEISRFYLHRVLSREGHVVDEADCGEKALELLCVNSYDAAFVDLQMPGLDGLDVLRRVRSGECGPDPNLPIAAITGHAQPGNCEHLLDAGMDGYLPKPASIQEVLAMLDRLIAISRSQ